METKKCKKCGETKLFKDFYINRRRKDGLCSHCKTCINKDNKEYREKNKEKIAERREKNKEKTKDYNLNYRKTDRYKESTRTSRKKYNQANPEKKLARKRVENAIKCGKLLRQPCEVCGSTHKIQAHHEDYSKPLEVNWLCRKHHDEIT